VPISSALTYVQGLLSGLEMPGNAPPLACQITPPDPFTDPGDTPTAYLWPADGHESRLGASTRNTGPGTSSGWKTIGHQMEIWLIWAGIDDGTALLFPGMVDAINAALRTAYPMPAIITDPYTEVESQMQSIGEDLTYRVSVRPVPDSRNNKYEALLQVPFTELIQA